MPSGQGYTDWVLKKQAYSSVINDKVTNGETLLYHEARVQTLLRAIVCDCGALETRALQGNRILESSLID